MARYALKNPATNRYLDESLNGETLASCTKALFYSRDSAERFLNKSYFNYEIIKIKPPYIGTEIDHE